MYRFISDTGLVLGPLLLGALSQGVSLNTASLVIAVIAFFTAAWAAWAVKETNPTARRGRARYTELHQIERTGAATSATVDDNVAACVEGEPPNNTESPAPANV